MDSTQTHFFVTRRKLKILFKVWHNLKLNDAINEQLHMHVNKHGVIE